MRSWKTVQKVAEVCSFSDPETFAGFDTRKDELRRKNREAAGLRPGVSRASGSAPAEHGYDSATRLYAAAINRESFYSPRSFSIMTQCRPGAAWEALWMPAHAILTNTHARAPGMEKF